MRSFFLALLLIAGLVGFVSYQRGVLELSVPSLAEEDVAMDMLPAPAGKPLPMKTGRYIVNPVLRIQRQEQSVFAPQAVVLAPVASGQFLPAEPYGYWVYIPTL